MQLAAAAVLSVALVAGWLVGEWRRSRPLPQVDPVLAQRFDRIIDSLNRVRESRLQRPPADTARGTPGGPLIHLNRATAAELERLPGVGRILAQRIVRYRDNYGPFRSLEQLKEVKGIGEAKLRQIAPYLRLD